MFEAMTANSPPGSSVRFTNISLEQGLSEATVYAIAQDHQGFLWFATQNGMNRYDGNTVVIYKHDDKKRANVTDSANA